MDECVLCKKCLARNMHTKLDAVVLAWRANMHYKSRTFSPFVATFILTNERRRSCCKHTPFASYKSLKLQPFTMPPYLF